MNYERAGLKSSILKLTGHKTRKKTARPLQDNRSFWHILMLLFLLNFNF